MKIFTYVTAVVLSVASLGLSAATFDFTGGSYKSEDFLNYSEEGFDLEVSAAKFKNGSVYTKDVVDSSAGLGVDGHWLFTGENYIVNSTYGG